MPLEDQPTPEQTGSRLQRIELKARPPGDEHRFWRAKFDMQGRNMGHTVIASEGANPLCICPNEDASNWVVRRLNRAAFIETAMLQMLESLVGFANANQNPNVDIKAGRVIEQLVKIWNEDESGQGVPADATRN